MCDMLIKESVVLGGVLELLYCLVKHAGNVQYVCLFYESMIERKGESAY